MDKVKLQKLQFRVQDGYLRKHPFKTIGNVLHWLYVYGDLRISDSAIVGEGKVEYRGKDLATFTFKDKLQMPVFEFNKDFDFWGVEMEKAQKIYLESLGIHR